MGTPQRVPVDHAPLRLLPYVDPQQVRDNVVQRLTDGDSTPADELDPVEIVVGLIDGVVSTRDPELRQQLLLEAALGWPDEAASEAAELLRGRSRRHRVAGADLMSCLCFYRPESNIEYAQALADAIDRETDVDVLSVLVLALSCAAKYEGYAAPESPAAIWQPVSPDDQGLMDRHEIWRLLADERLEKIVAIASAAAASSRRRFAVALASFDLSDGALRATLLGLTADQADEVRDWATFVVMQAYPELDGDDVRSALLARVADTDWEVRDQAIRALAVRKAKGGFELLERGLREAPSDYLLQAAADLRDPALLPAVMSITKGRDCVWFEQAVEACGGAAAAPRR